jgi:hypothetical protein
VLCASQESRSNWGGPHLGGKYNVLSWIVSTEKKRVPRFSRFPRSGEQGRWQLSSEWMKGRLRSSRVRAHTLGEVMGRKPHFSKIARSGAPPSNSLERYLLRCRCGPPASQLVFATVRPMRAITIVKLVHDDRVTAAKHLGFARAVSIFSSCVQEKL